MTGLIYFLILFFIFLISYQLFLAYFSGYLEGLTNNTASTTPTKPTTTTTTTQPTTTTTTTKPSSTITTSTKPTTSTTSTTTTSTTSKGNITTADTTTKDVIAPTTSVTTINASAINSDNIVYIPYTSTSESVPSLVGQNTNNILYLKEKMDNLFQQVQDISGNLTSVNTVQSSQASQFGKVNNVVSAAQSKIQQLPTPQVKGLN